MDKFRNRWNNYKYNDRKYLNIQPSFQQHIFEHFNGSGYSSLLENISITFIGKTNPSGPEKRKLLDSNFYDHGSFGFKCSGKQWLIEP